MVNWQHELKMIGVAVLYIVAWLVTLMAGMTMTLDFSAGIVLLVIGGFLMVVALIVHDRVTRPGQWRNEAQPTLARPGDNETGGDAPQQ